MIPLPLLIALLLFSLAAAIVAYAYRHAPLEVREDAMEYDNECDAPDGRAYRVLVADCAGRDSAAWMTDNRIVAELDARLWQTLTERHGRPLEVTLR